MEVKSRLWCKLFCKSLPIAYEVDWRHELELVAESALEGEEAPFEKDSGLRELSLQSEVVSYEDQGFMMVEITMTEFDQGMDVHRLLNLSELKL